jgi:hypothetical protein
MQVICSSVVKCNNNKDHVVGMIFLFTLFTILMAMITLIIVVLATSVSNSSSDSEDVVKGITLFLSVIAFFVLIFIMFYV